MLVASRTKDDDVKWMEDNYIGHNDYVNSSIYFAGDVPETSLHVAANKGLGWCPRTQRGSSANSEYRVYGLPFIHYR